MSDVLMRATKNGDDRIEDTALLRLWFIVSPPQVSQIGQVGPRGVGPWGSASSPGNGIRGPIVC